MQNVALLISANGQVKTCPYGKGSLFNLYLISKLP